MNDELIIEIIEMVETNMVGIMDKKTVAENLQTLLNQQKPVKNNVVLSDVVERVSRMKDDSGREGCTYGDTDYDSMTVVYGYNLAIDDVTDTLGKL